MVASATGSPLPIAGYLPLSNGYTVEYQDVGEGEPIVVVPGLAGGIALLEPLISSLSAHHRVIACQLRGECHGLFDRGYPFGQFAKDLDQLIGRLRLERPGLIGVSFGGAVALDYATRCSHKLAFLAVQGVGKRYVPGFFGNVAREVLDRLPLPDDNPFVNQFFRVLIGDRRMRNDYYDFVVDRCWRTDQSVMAHRFALLDDFDIEARLSSVVSPTLVLGAERDVLVSPAEARDLAGQLPHSRFDAVSQAGHLAFVTHSRLVSERIADFAQSIR